VTMLAFRNEDAGSFRPYQNLQTNVYDTGRTFQIPHADFALPPAWHLGQSKFLAWTNCTGSEGRGFEPSGPAQEKSRGYRFRSVTLFLFTTAAP
jgi:hypothetical protein